MREVFVYLLALPVSVVVVMLVASVRGRLPMPPRVDQEDKDSGA